ncbi:MAG: GNAT family N-acetyltransferase [Myxococcota bacterium]
MDPNMLRGFRADSRTMVRELGFLRDEWAPAGIAHAQVHLLLELSERGVMRPSELAERLLSDPAVISRGLKALSGKGLVEARPDPADGRQRQVMLTGAGRAVVQGVHADADSQVRHALQVLGEADQDVVLRGMHAYAKALHRSRIHRDFRIREIRPSDDPFVTSIIRAVMPAFGASGSGFALHDAEVEAMCSAYAAPRCGYWVVLRGDTVLGGAGYAPLVDGPPGVCELRKMYFMPEIRGLGLGARLLRTVLTSARAEGFQSCYLETLERMTQARRLYEDFGFVQSQAPLGNTGHHGCDAWYTLDLTTPSTPASL